MTDSSNPIQSTDGDRVYAVVLHLSTFVFPLLGPLVMWLIRNDSPFVDHHGRESVNFHLTLLIVSAACVVLSLVTCGVGAIVAVPVLLALWVVNLVFSILAAVAANRGERYRYPLTLRML